VDSIPNNWQSSISSLPSPGIFGAYLACNPVGIWSSFPGIRRSDRDSNHSPPISAVPKHKKIGAISAHNCLQGGGEASIQNRDFDKSRLIGSDMPRYKYGRIMDRWLFGEKKNSLVPIHLPRNPYGLSWNWIRDSAAWFRRLNWVTAKSRQNFLYEMTSLAGRWCLRLQRTVFYLEDRGRGLLRNTATFPPHCKWFTDQKTIKFTVDTLENTSLTIPPTISIAISFNITFLAFTPEGRLR